MTTAVLPFPTERQAERPRRVAIYCRISLDKAGDELGVQRQQALCRSLVEARGWSDVEVFTDNDYSATSGKKRPAYTQMLARVERGHLDTIVCVDQDRLLRRPIELETLISHAEKLGLWVVTANGDLDLTNEDGQMRARIQASVAAHEVAKKGKRQKRAEAQARELRKPPRRWSFGYRPGGMELDPGAADAVRDAYAYMIETSGRGSLAEIARRWNEAGLTTSFGKPWTHIGVRSVLLNPRNASLQTFGRTETGEKGTWPEIVPEETFRIVAALLADPARRKVVDSGVRKWIGAGVFRCGRCGEPMSSDRAHDTGRRVYKCKTKHLTRVAEPIDELVLATIEARLARPDVADLVTVEAPEDRELSAQATALRAHMRRLEQDYGDGEIPARVWREQTARKQSELDRVEAQRAAIRRTSELAPVLSASDPVAAFRALDVTRKSAMIDVLMTVTVLPSTGGSRPFDPATVRIDWAV